VFGEGSKDPFIDRSLCSRILCYSVFCCRSFHTFDISVTLVRGCDPNVQLNPIQTNPSLFPSYCYEKICRLSTNLSSTGSHFLNLLFLAKALHYLRATNKAFEVFQYQLQSPLFWAYQSLFLCVFVFCLCGSVISFFIRADEEISDNRDTTAY
jgi:hypothetical protein